LGALHDTGLTPGTTYYYILMAQDSAGSPATVSSGQVTITTYPFNTVILGVLGDSLSFGAHASASAPSAGNVDNSYSPASQFCFMANANQDLNNYIAYNMAVSGSETGNDSTGWYPGTSYYDAAIAVFTKAQVTDILFMLGTNDARVGTSAATYRSNVAAICAGLLTVGSIARVHLNFSPYDRSSGGDESLLITYKAQLQALANGSTIIMGDTTAHQTIYDYSINGYNVYYTADYIHLIDPGYVMLASLWWKAFDNLGATAGFRPVALGGGING
jgi:lysophospholipase L1-like esterase